MGRKVMVHVCVVCWERRNPSGRDHPPHVCVHAECECCGFKAVEAALKARGIKEAAP